MSENVGTRMLEKIKPISKKAARTGAAVAVGVGASFLPVGPDSAHADDPTATPSPTPTLTHTPTATPDVRGTQIAIEQKKVDEAIKERDDQKKINDLHVTQTAVTKETNALKGTPTEAPPPTNTPTVTPTLTPEQIEIQMRAGVITPTPNPNAPSTVEPTPNLPRERPTHDGSPLGGIALAGAAATIAGVAAWKNRERIGDAIKSVRRRGEDAEEAEDEEPEPPDTVV